ncbi:MAG: hypothetical protein R6X22_00020 [Gemmatimonadota bacterium]|jgi:hypothetical protein
MADRLIVLRDDGEGLALKVVKIAAIALAGAAVLSGLGVWLARDQMARHQRELFSSQPLRRLAALGYLRNHAGVDNVLLLRDYLAWEDKPLLRKRALAILSGMEEDLAAAEGA